MATDLAGDFPNARLRAAADSDDLIQRVTDWAFEG
jgi:hypothetical protein